MNFQLNHLPLSARPERPLAPSLEQVRLRLVLGLMFLDIITIVVGYGFTGLLYYGDPLSEYAARSAMLMGPVFLVVGVQSGLYRPQINTSFPRAARKCISTIAIAFVGLLFIMFYAKASDNFSRVVFTFGSAFSLLLMLLSRSVVISLVKRFVGPSLTNTMVIHDDGPSIDMKHAFCIDAAQHGLSPDATDPLNLDRVGRYLQNMDRVIICCRPEERNRWAALLRSAGVQGEFVSESLRKLGAFEMKRERGFSTIVVSTRPLGIRARATKRMLDVCLSSIALLLLSPLIIIVAALIKLEDGGAILFRQQRMGRGNRFFWIYKFRSMREAHSDAHGLRSASRDDDRTTRIGKIIRRTSIDELPQLFNVWRGDMSLVGPRPHALGSQAGEKLFWEIDGRYWNRHVLKPGLTGLAQVRGFRGATDQERDLTDRLQADLEYISNWSLWLDLKIIVKTFGVLVHDNAF
ncbi:exopolysaccharide biosynthesis polyprenyl glycosylphosphotransferase [Altererythrobacter atlanticus]|uniref:UDP-glucose:undecaprenyl-phosphate glucose-1-phosphate transferase n=1 Tax=Croceibacterium atlanticum TaxID=1267766 RepID=A0A0F7KP38_9SPHN|nr:exopolysaccharide biosynthesis polyprenyl glycosylphosphotransferase [Croceibacterium atlanticum]AKH41354.1 UDP-glucose:undecaprenyl-phosphate glucose-1-phosphate transferase [Croceibacterium atlanticum]MBB5734132.1 exopolysaccharide biosynthesis polyprenyl glycosylphosphotransferase [Croceibacterium atlanticum]